MATCSCGKEFSDKRKAIGYDTCLVCGEEEAREQAILKGKQVAPAYNKGAYQFITSRRMVLDVGKK